jgi:hypothetical protein
MLSRVNGVKYTDSNFNFDCIACLIGKSKLQHYTKSTREVKEIGETIRSDVFRPVSLPGLKGEVYILAFIDYFSDHKWVIPHQTSKI